MGDAALQTMDVLFCLNCGRTWLEIPRATENMCVRCFGEAQAPDLVGQETRSDEEPDEAELSHQTWWTKGKGKDEKGKRRSKGKDKGLDMGVFDEFEMGKSKGKGGVKGKPKGKDKGQGKEKGNGMGENEEVDPVEMDRDWPWLVWEGKGK